MCGYFMQDVGRQPQQRRGALPTRSHHFSFEAVFSQAAMRERFAQRDAELCVCLRPLAAQGPQSSLPARLASVIALNKGYNKGAVLALKQEHQCTKIQHKSDS